MMLLDPFLYDFAAAHQRALREAGERPGRPGARGPGWWRMPLGLSALMASRTVLSGASQRLLGSWLPACRHVRHGV